MKPTTIDRPPRELKTRIALDRLVDLEETRDVRPINQDHVERLAVAVDALPPVDVVKLTEQRFGLLAGYHRREAHRLAKRATMRVVIHDPDTEEWFGFAVRSNLAHGLPLTMAERKAAALRMLKDGDKRSDRVIAEDCGLSHPTVAKLREARFELEDEETEASTGKNYQLRVGRDGKARRVPGVLLEEPPLPAAQDSARQRVTPWLGTWDQDLAEDAGAQEALNAWSEAFDGLTRALSYAKTFHPPEEIPDRYGTVAEFQDRYRRLGEAVTEWGRK